MGLLTIELSPELDGRLEAVAGQRSEDKTRFVIKALENLLDEKPGPSKNSNRVLNLKPFSNGQTFYDLTNDVCGKCEGPDDLSTNRSIWKGSGNRRGPRSVGLRLLDLGRIGVKKMNPHQSIVLGTIQSDGSLQLDENPGLPPGRVEVILHTLEGHGVTPDSLPLNGAKSRPPGPRRTPRPGSALELAGDLVGSVDGPGDLSTNPKYMEGYGR